MARTYIPVEVERRVRVADRNRCGLAGQAFF